LQNFGFEPLNDHFVNDSGNKENADHFVVCYCY
jgi:hypothetical protein